MNIDRINSSNISKIYSKNKSGMQKVASNKEIAKDGIVLSESAKVFSVALKQIQDQPEIREAKVNEVSEKVKNGEYHVKKDDIAEKLLKNAIFIK